MVKVFFSPTHGLEKKVIKYERRRDILRIHKEFTDKENEKVIDALCAGLLTKGAHLLEYLECVPDRY